MAKSYTQLRNLYGTLTNNTDATNLTLGDQLINDSTRTMCSTMDWPFMQKTASINRTASTQTYNLAYDYDKMVSVYVTVGGFQYTPVEITNRMEWDKLNQSTTVISDYATQYFIGNGTISFYPIPATTTASAITVTYISRVTDLSQADYTTGNVSALTTATTAVTGTGTTWTAPMIGRWIKISTTNTAGSAGDNLWYQISAVGSTTTLTLSRAYNGATISGNTAFTIGEMSILPEAYQDLPVYRAAHIYFSSVQPETPRAALFKAMYDEGYENMVEDQSNKSASPVTDWGDYRSPINPNLGPMSIG